MAKAKSTGGKNPTKAGHPEGVRRASRPKAGTAVGGGMPPMTGMIRARIDPALKVRAEAILDQLGLSASDVIRLLYKQITICKGLPFDVRIPNATTRRALRDADRGKDLTRYESFDDFTKAMTGR